MCSIRGYDSCDSVHRMLTKGNVDLIVHPETLNLWSLKGIILLQIESLEGTVDCTSLAVEKVWRWKRLTSNATKLLGYASLPSFSNNMGLARVSQDCIVNILQERKFPRGSNTIQHWNEDTFLSSILPSLFSVIIFCAN